MGHPRAKKTRRRRCDLCGGKAIYDEISARMDALYSQQHVIRCPQNRGYHLTSQLPEEHPR